jgi:hypothetical protein
VDRILNEIAREEGEIQNLLIDIYDKLSQWFRYIKGIDRIRIPRTELDLTFNGRRPMG